VHNIYTGAQCLHQCSVPVEAGGRKITEELSVQIVGEIRLILNFDWCRHIGYICLYSGLFGEACNRVCQFPIRFHICRSPIRVSITTFLSSPIQVVGSVSARHLFHEPLITGCYRHNSIAAVLWSMHGRPQGRQQPEICQWTSTTATHTIPFPETLLPGRGVSPRCQF
jgi:hypothetical protein